MSEEKRERQRKERRKTFTLFDDLVVLARVRVPATTESARDDDCQKKKKGSNSDNGQNSGHVKHMEKGSKRCRPMDAHAAWKQAREFVHLTKKLTFLSKSQNGADEKTSSF